MRAFESQMGLVTQPQVRNEPRGQDGPQGQLDSELIHVRLEEHAQHALQPQGGCTPRRAAGPATARWRLLRAKPAYEIIKIRFYRLKI